MALCGDCGAATRIVQECGCHSSEFTDPVSHVGTDEMLFETYVSCTVFTKAAMQPSRCKLTHWVAFWEVFTEGVPMIVSYTSFVPPLPWNIGIRLVSIMDLRLIL